MSFHTIGDPKNIYLDHNATTPISEEVHAGISQWLVAWGNPSSIHQNGRSPKRLIREARSQIGKMVGCDPLEIVFTSGGSEANNTAIKGVFEKYSFTLSARNHYLVSAVEHPSVMRTFDYLKRRGAEVEIIPVNREGAIDLAIYEKMLRDTTALVSVMYANNETGNIFPIGKMAKMARARGALFHTDAVQTLGKIPLNLKALGVDLASFSGHKFYALRGSGFLYNRRGLLLESLIHGGAQERHRRGGTENLLAIASLGKMAERAGEIEVRAVEMQKLRDFMESRLLSEISGLRVTGGSSPRLPNSSSMLIPGIDGEILLMNLDLHGFSVSTGAACSSGSPEPSPVLLAIGLTRKEAQSSLRVGLGWGTTAEQIELFIATLKEVIQHLRSIGAEGVMEHASGEMVYPHVESSGRNHDVIA